MCISCILQFSFSKKLGIHYLWLGRFWGLLLILILICNFTFSRHAFIAVYKGLLFLCFLGTFNILNFRKLIKFYICAFYYFVSINIQALISFASSRIAKKYAFITFCIKLSIPRLFKYIALTSKYFEMFNIRWMTIS